MTFFGLLDSEYRAFEPAIPPSAELGRNGIKVSRGTREGGRSETAKGATTTASSFATEKTTIWPRR